MKLYKHPQTENLHRAGILNFVANEDMILGLQVKDYQYGVLCLTLRSQKSIVNSAEILNIHAKCHETLTRTFPKLTANVTNELTNTQTNKHVRPQ